MSDVQTRIADAHQFLKMSAIELYKLTPAEYLAMRKGAVEGVYDELERYSVLAIMIGNAVNASKRIKATDLFKRPTGEIKTGKTADDVKERQQAIIERLERFEEFKGKFREEETDG